MLGFFKYSELRMEISLLFFQFTIKVRGYANQTFFVLNKKKKIGECKT